MNEALWKKDTKYKYTVSQKKLCQNVVNNSELCETLADFNNFLHATSRSNVTYMTIVLPTSPWYCCYSTLWNAEVVVWIFTTMNSYWVPHAGSENQCETRKLLKNTYLTLIRSKSIVPRSRTSTNWNDASTASGLLWVMPLLNVIMSSLYLTDKKQSISWHSFLRHSVYITLIECM